ncbi:MAG: hypothetical protein L6Q38_06185 [Nitrospira sp.]|nr:hypothetical protein [Nitrospira sp.]
MSIPGIVEGLNVDAYFTQAQAVWSWLDESMAELPEEIRPTHFGNEQRIRRKALNAIADRERFDHFRSKKQGGGFFLHGDRISVLLSPYPGAVPSSIWVSMSKGDPRFVRHASTFLASFARHGAVWGFAGEWDEYTARNQYRIVYVDRGSCTGLVGRDFRRYVPGLYWLNYFSNDYVRRMEIEVEALAARLGGIVTPITEGKILRLYEAPSDWTARRREVEDVIHQTKNFFSIRNVHIPTNLAMVNPDGFRWSPVDQWP